MFNQAQEIALQMEAADMDMMHFYNSEMLKDTTLGPKCECNLQCTRSSIEDLPTDVHCFCCLDNDLSPVLH